MKITNQQVNTAIRLIDQWAQRQKEALQETLPPEIGRYGDPDSVLRPETPVEFPAYLVKAAEAREASESAYEKAQEVYRVAREKYNKARRDAELKFTDKYKEINLKKRETQDRVGVAQLEGTDLCEILKTLGIGA